MKKFLMISTGVLVSALLLGEVFYPDFPLVWMASEAPGYAYIRAAIVVVLTTLLFSELGSIPIVRPLLLMGAAALVALSVVLLVSDQLHPADGVIFIETAIVLVLEVLEAPARAVRAFNGRPVGKFGVGNDFVKIG